MAEVRPQRRGSGRGHHDRDAPHGSTNGIRIRLLRAAPTRSVSNRRVKGSLKSLKERLHAECCSPGRLTSIQHQTLLRHLDDSTVDGRRRAPNRCAPAVHRRLDPLALEFELDVPLPLRQPCLEVHLMDQTDHAVNHFRIYG